MLGVPRLSGRVEETEGNEENEGRKMPLTPALSQRERGMDAAQMIVI
jgi:hypothetical protein